MQGYNPLDKILMRLRLIFVQNNLQIAINYLSLENTHVHPGHSPFRIVLAVVGHRGPVLVQYWVLGSPTGERWTGLSRSVQAARTCGLNPLPILNAFQGALSESVFFMAPTLAESLNSTIVYQLTFTSRADGRNQLLPKLFLL